MDKLSIINLHSFCSPLTPLNPASTILMGNKSIICFHQVKNGRSASHSYPGRRIKTTVYLCLEGNERSPAPSILSIVYQQGNQLTAYCFCWAEPDELLPAGLHQHHTVENQRVLHTFSGQRVGSSGRKSTLH